MLKLVFRYKDGDIERKMKDSNLTGPFQGMVFKRHFLNFIMLSVTSHLKICEMLHQNCLIVPGKCFASSQVSSSHTTDLKY